MIPRSQRMASPVDGVAATIERALTARRPKARYVVGAGPRAQVAAGGADADPGPRRAPADRERRAAAPVTARPPASAHPGPMTSAVAGGLSLHDPHTDREHA